MRANSSTTVDAFGVAKLGEDKLLSADVSPVGVTGGGSASSFTLLANGSLVPITNDSNEVALAVIPRIANDAVDTMTDYVTLTLANTFDLALPDLAIQLFCDGEVYLPGALTTAGNYDITGTNTLVFHAHFLTDEDGAHAVRLIINCAESAPYWVETEAP